MSDKRLMMHMTARMAAEDVGEVILDGVFTSMAFWDDDICSTDVRRTLEAVKDAETLNIRINSPGGDAMQAMAIKNQIMAHKAKRKCCYIEGMCASAATLPMLAADEVVIFDGAEIMIHRPSCYAGGSADELDSAAASLRVLENDVKRMYAEFSHNDEDTIWEWMKGEKWFSAEEAVECGFATRVEYGAEPIAMMAMDAGTIQMLAYKNHTLTETTPESDGNNLSEKEEKKMTRDELQRDFPELYEEVFTMGVNSERERMMGIDDAALTGMEEMTREAKYVKPMQAGEFGLAVLKEAKKRGFGFMQARREETSQNAEVEGDAAETAITEHTMNEADIKAMAEDAVAEMKRKGII